MVKVKQTMRCVEVVGIRERCEFKEKFTLGDFIAKIKQPNNILFL